MRRLWLAVLLVFASALARTAAQQGMPNFRTPEVVVTPDRLERLDIWVKAVDRHQPGEIDDAVDDVGGWSNEQLRALWVDLEALAQLVRNLRLYQFTIKPEGQAKATVIHYPALLLQRLRVLACAASGQLAHRDCVEIHATHSLDDDLVRLAAHAGADRDRTGEDNYLLKRAALLHADIATLQPTARIEPFSGSVGPGRWLGPQSWRVDISDGRSVGAGMTASHWDVARLALDHVRPPRSDKPAPERDAMVRAWYRATSAWMQFREDHDTEHLDHGRRIFPDDPHLLFLSGCQRETFASPAIQVAARSVSLPTGLVVGVSSDRAELRQAEAFFRRAIALRPDMAEAHLRLGRVLALTGRHAEAATEIQLALPHLEDDELRYYGELFAGAEEEALGRFDAARAAFERAAALFPLAQSPLVALSELAHRRGDRTGALAAMQKVFGLPAEDRARDDPWWHYHVAQARNADALLDAIRGSFRRVEP